MDAPIPMGWHCFFVPWGSPLFLCGCPHPLGFLFMGDALSPRTLGGTTASSGAPRSPEFQGGTIASSGAPCSPGFRGGTIASSGAPRSPGLQDGTIASSGAPRSPGFQGSTIASLGAPRSLGFQGGTTASSGVPRSPGFQSGTIASSGAPSRGLTKDPNFLGSLPGQAETPSWTIRMTFCPPGAWSNHLAQGGKRSSERSRRKSQPGRTETLRSLGPL